MTITNLRPLHDRIIVKLIKLPAITKGGIHIPDAAMEKPLEATVIAVGNGRVMENGVIMPMDVKVGDVVLFAKYAGTEVKTEKLDEEHLILREEDVLAVVAT